MYIRTKDELESRDRRHTIVRWTASIFGLSLFNDLVKSGRAYDLGGQHSFSLPEYDKPIVYQENGSTTS